MSDSVPDEVDGLTDYLAMVSVWVAETIPEMEAGIHGGTLAELIERPDVQEVVGSAVVERYRTISVEKLKHDPVFRANWTRKFIEVFQRSIRPPRKIFFARADVPRQVLRLWSVTDPVPPSIVANHYQGEVTLRADQVLSARRWGSWFSFEDELLERFYLTFLIGRSLQTLASNIKNLWNIEATYLSEQSNLDTAPAWNSELRGGQFEHLMLDVLNELAPLARPAPLAEDILERTDLRVTCPNIKRKGGARVQVSLTADPESHERKVGAMYLPREFILLTPLELAVCAIDPPAVPKFDAFPWKAFWASFGGECKDEYAFAQELRRLFTDALAFPVEHPLGPMWILPPPLRQFIRIFVEHGAAETTNCVRERLEKSQRKVDSVHKYTSRYWKAKFSDDKQEVKPALPPNSP